MSFKDPYDTHAAREAAANRKLNAGLAEKRAERSALNERALNGLYKDARLCKVDQHTHAVASQAGIVNAPELEALKSRTRARFAPLLRENPEITPELMLDLVQAKPVPAARVSQREELLVDLIKQPLEGRSAAVQRVARFNEALPKARPVLNAFLKQGSGSAVPVVRAIMEASPTFARPSSESERSALNPDLPPAA